MSHSYTSCKKCGDLTYSETALYCDNCSSIISPKDRSLLIKTLEKMIDGGSKDLPRTLKNVKIAVVSSGPYNPIWVSSKIPSNVVIVDDEYELEGLLRKEAQQRKNEIFELKAPLIEYYEETRSKRRFQMRSNKKQKRKKSKNGKTKKRKK